MYGPPPTPVLADQHRPLRAVTPFTALAACLLLGGMAHVASHFGYTIDDAYITFRYARNLARGLGLVYNPGEYVKGYSNTLLTVLCVLPASVGADPSAFVKTLSVLSYGVMLWVCARRFASNALSALVVLASLALCTPLAVWFAAGLETGLYTALIVLACARRLREQERGGGLGSGLSFALVALSRPEGILFFLAALAHDLAFRPRMRKLARADLAFYLLPPMCCGAELLISHAYYGAALPSTFYAKVGASASIGGSLLGLLDGVSLQLTDGSYLRTRLAAALGSGYVLLLALPALVARARLRQHAACVLMALAQLVFLAVAREDWMPAGRFIVPLLPFALILIAEGLGAAWRGRSRLRAAGALGAAAFVAWLAAVSWPTSRTVRAERRLDAGAKLADGRAYAQLAPPGSVLSSYDIGGQGWGSGFAILDADGLIDRRMARCARRPLECALYGELVWPELIRKHPGRKGSFAGRTAFIKANYVMLKHHGWVRVAKTAILTGSLPATAHARDHTLDSGFRIEGYGGPRFVRAGQRIELELYWRRASQRHEIGDRRVELRSADGRVLATGSPTVWSYANDLRAWKPHHLFIDRVWFEPLAPAGPLQVWAVAGGAEVAVAELDVLEREAAEREASRLLASTPAGASAAHVAQRYVALREASALSHQRVLHLAYQRAAIDHAQTVVPPDLEALPPQEQLAWLRDARRILHRAADESFFVGPLLRRAIDDNAARRDALIAQELTAAFGP